MHLSRARVPWTSFCSGTLCQHFNTAQAIVRMHAARQVPCTSASAHAPLCDGLPHHDSNLASQRVQLTNGLEHADREAILTWCCCRDAILHVCRIHRVLMQPRGNALLVGVGGSGRKSLSRLATYVAEQKCFSIEISKGYRISEFREDLKSLYRQVIVWNPLQYIYQPMQSATRLSQCCCHVHATFVKTTSASDLQAGCQNKPTVFLFDETQIVQETFLEDINNILTSGTPATFTITVIN